MPYRSKQQWRWAFATKQPFARKWAHETKSSYRSLPHKKTKTKSSGGRRRGRR
jgi:hypothetical protein